MGIQCNNFIRYTFQELSNRFKINNYTSKKRTILSRDFSSKCILIRERYRSFQPLIIDEMMQGQRGWRELAFLGDKVSCYKPDAWAFEEGTPHSDFPGPNSGITTCVAVIRHTASYNLCRDHKPDLEAEKERILKSEKFICDSDTEGMIDLLCCWP
ncbi:hypothetical protein IGI04_031390 [Brassica rapa subsp. trilocularis]|uniref:Uncharacterized protein n=1 Tax=Brassica rapa subsp. trilocularis TaxID=1813537 RepID=A0ABQ7LWS4_BRACM|nr:hypothetical protein IGI04_031390 [Brassica rapa subsp. trilocularis]